MRRERVSDDIYVFTSQIYAQVTAAAIVQKEGIIVVDTLPFPEETQGMIDYLNSLGKGEIKYLINTHWHADHTNGNYLFDDSVQLICHVRCRQEMERYAQQALDEAKLSAPELEGVEIRIPDLVFDSGDLVIHIGGKSIELRLLPGHTRDLTVAYVREDKVLLASDSMMPVPYFVAGNRHDFRESLRRILDYPLESVVQGHGEVLLRGEIPRAVEASLRYLDTIETRVKHLVDEDKPISMLNRITIDECGRSRIPLNGLVQDLHLVNMQMLYHEFMEQRQNGTEEA